MDEDVCKTIDDLKSEDVFSKDFAADVDKKATKLTDAEKQARQEWNELREGVVDKITSQEMSLKLPFESWKSSPLLPPQLDDKFPSARSKFNEQRSKRHYPQQIHEWEDFQGVVVKKPMNRRPSAQAKLFNPLLGSIQFLSTAASEMHEQNYLQSCVWAYLEKAGLMSQKRNVAMNPDTQIAAVTGLPDAVDYAGGNDPSKAGRISFVIECKSSHNLLAPNDFKSLKERYESGMLEQRTNRSADRSKWWSQICHPFAQLFAYMIDNNVRFGALCSASKTYFVFFDGQGNDVGTVRITGAHQTAQRGFFNDWIMFCQEARERCLSSEPQSFSCPDSWLKETPIKEDIEPGAQIPVLGSNSDDASGPGSGKHGERRSGPNNGDDGPRKLRRVDSGTTSEPRGSTGQSKQTSSRADEATVSDAPDLKDSPPEHKYDTFRHNGELFDFEDGFVDFYPAGTIQVGCVLGTGRNGDVFESSFTNKAGHTEIVAVKQFDLSKSFESYKNEVEAYKFLKNAWGELVPGPKFISSSPSGMVRFLGLEKGTMPEGDVGAERAKLLHRLKKEYNFDHLDSSHGQNTIYLTDDRGTNRLVLIDLESWEKLGPAT